VGSKWTLEKMFAQVSEEDRKFVNFRMIMAFNRSLSDADRANTFAMVRHIRDLPANVRMRFLYKNTPVRELVELTKRLAAKYPTTIGVGVRHLLAEIKDQDYNMREDVVRRMSRNPEVEKFLFGVNFD
jgi:phage-related protein